MKLLSAIPRSSDARDQAALARVAGWLAPKLFLLEANARRVADALKLAADAIGPAYGIDPVLIFDALKRREQAASTALGAGFAIPHARLPGIDRPVTAFVRLRSAIAFGASDRLPVACLLVILVPKDGADDDHLKMLSLIAELFSQREFKKEIGTAPDVATARAIFSKGIEDLMRAVHEGRVAA